MTRRTTLPTLLAVALALTACAEESTRTVLSPEEEQALDAPTVGAPLVDFQRKSLAPPAASRSSIRSTTGPLSLARPGAAVQLGVWYPYGRDPVAALPPASVLAAAGIQLSFITGNLTAAELAKYDVVYVGRNGMGGFHGNRGVSMDLPAVKSWVSGGGGLIGESNATIYDSDYQSRGPWSSELAAVMGIAGPQDGSDNGVPKVAVILVAPGHRIARDLPPTFDLTAIAWTSVKFGVVVDNLSNPTAIAVANVLHASGSSPIVAAEYGDGCTVYLPPAPGYGDWIDWSVNSEYQQLVINAVLHCGGEPIITATIDVKPGSETNPINLRSNGLIPVAILSTGELTATEIDGGSVVFGPGGATAAHSRHEDVDGDGVLDYMLHFPTAEAGLPVGETEVCLTGSTIDGRAFEGCDVVDVRLRGRPGA